MPLVGGGGGRKVTPGVTALRKSRESALNLLMLNKLMSIFSEAE